MQMIEHFTEAFTDEVVTNQGEQLLTCHRASHEGTYPLHIDIEVLLLRPIVHISKTAQQMRS